MERIYLSRRNLMMLLSKLDRARDGEITACSIIKYQNDKDVFVQSMDAIAVTAVEDSALYANRSAGPMHEADEVNYATSVYQKIMGEPDVHTRDAPAPDNAG